jgi:signal transduction histidine kinase/ligand-binding sensor domain-containing protein/CheY-like chemotaxis protein/AraC-like DNA-binding protein
VTTLYPAAGVHSRWRLALAAVALVVAQPAVGQPATSAFVHESWTVRDGLPVNFITALLQDRQGYLWLATMDGVARFDGVRFTIFNIANTPGLPTNRIGGLAEARDGALWLWTDQGTMVRLHGGRATLADLGDARVSSGSALFTDAAGDVWVATTRGVWSVRADRLVPVARPSFDGQATALVRRRDGSLWVGTPASGLIRMDGDSAVRVVTRTGLDEAGILALAEDDAGALWVATAGGAWREHGGRFVRLNTMTGPDITHFLASRTAGVMFAFAQSGAYRADSTGWRLVTRGSAFTEPWSDGSSVWYADGPNVYRDGELVYTAMARAGNLIRGMSDREGSVWLGTATTGLHRLKPALFSMYGGQESSLSSLYVTYADRSGNVWIPAPGGVSRIDGATGRLATVSFADSTVVYNPSFEDAEGRLWLGGGGVFACTLPAMTCTAAGLPELAAVRVHAMHPGPDGRHWVGSAAGLYRLNGRDLTRQTPADGAPVATVRAFAATADGAVWMGTNGGGLARYGEGRFTHVTTADGLPSNLVRAFHYDTDGWLWVGTEGGGVARLDPRAWAAAPSGDRRIVSINARDGLYDDMIHQILEDDYGRLWMSANRGIFWLRRDELIAFADGRATRIHSRAYTEHDGLSDREANGGSQPAGAKTPDGRLWFPTQGGLAVVDPARVRRAAVAPAAIIEQVVAGTTPLAAARVKPGGDPAGRIDVAPDQRDFQIEYTAPTFLEPANVRFRYRLDGYDRDWADAGNRRTAFYTQVPPGTYTFRVQATDGSGEWYGDDTVALRVLPRFHETGAFRLALLATLALLALLALRWRLASLRARARALERMVDERTATLLERERQLAAQNDVLAAQTVELRSLDRAKTRFFANISHELRTPLTLTIGPLEDLRAHANGEPRAERWLDIALRNSRRLLRLVNQILDVAKLEAGQMRLAPRLLDLASFVRGVSAAFEPVAERRAIELSVAAPASDPLCGAFDPDAIEKILTNLLSNALKFTPERGRVALVVEAVSDGGTPQESEWVRIRVEDTGPGFTADQLEHVFDRFWQVDEALAPLQPGTGIGLSLVKELVGLHGGTIVATSDGPGAGAEFTILLPLLRTPAGVAAVAVRTDDDAAALVPAGIGEAAYDGSLDRPAQPAPASHDTGDGRADEDVPTLLIVDDSADLRAYIRDQFTDRFRVLEAGDGRAGIDLARRHLPDVIISDVMMTGTDGHALVRALRGHPETDFLPIILLTAQAEDDQRLAGLESGADDYLIKPFDRRELQARVRNLIASRRRLRERLAGRRVELPAPAPGLAPADRAFLDRVRKAIEDNLGDPDFGVPELAKAVFMDRSHLFRRTRELLGAAPSDLLRSARLDHGARLLRAGTGTVGDVAYASGFNSVSYFCRCFHEVHGATPAAFRAAARMT